MRRKKEHKELYKAMLRERINITSKMLEIGYFPYLLKFNDNGTVQLELRNSFNSDQSVLKSMINELSNSISGMMRMRSSP